MQLKFLIDIVPLLLISTTSLPLCLSLWLPRPVGHQLAMQGPNLGVREKPFWGSEQPDWAQYAPYVPAGDYEDVPEGCTVTQVNLLERHGARYPTTSAASNIQQALVKLQTVQTWNDPKLDFISTYVYDLGTDDLVPLGISQSKHSGRVHYERYKHLVSANNLPFVRASGSDRVVLAAESWNSGFAEANKYRFKPILSVILNEAGNDTLDDEMCPNAGKSTAQKSIWEGTFAPPIRARLNKLANQDLGLTDGDVPMLISLCAFDSVAKEKMSKWCGLFDKGCFEAFEYWGDLDKFYKTGHGQPLGPVQGVGYINELLARLTHTPVQDTTQTNTTLDASPITFPLNRSVYADFSHDNEMIAIYSAMGLFRVEPLDPSGKKDESRDDGDEEWVTRKMVPFSGRMVVEKMSCSKSSTHSSHTTAESEKEYVRILVNDKTMPLQFCRGVKKDGLCALDEFVESQRYARSGGGGDWEKCFE
jgi:hypothetical protein